MWDVLRNVNFENLPIIFWLTESLTALDDDLGVREADIFGVLDKVRLFGVEKKPVLLLDVLHK